NKESLLTIHIFLNKHQIISSYKISAYHCITQATHLICFPFANTIKATTLTVATYFTTHNSQKLTYQSTNLPPANFDIYQILSIFANQIDFENYNL
ncbi:MAG: hypothetical protein SOX26_04615, partial [Phocaeicola sp.]|nr:hypothetical protein [Phocaeicola sp.]